MSVVTWHSHNTKYTACSVECCQHPEHGNLVAVGTYQLNQETGHREGQTELGVVTTTDSESVSYESHSILDTCSGVLDMKWSRHEKPLLAAAKANGKVDIYDISLDDSGKCHLKLKHEEEITSGLCLALEWSRDNEKLVVTDSLGHVTVIRVTRDGCSTQANINGHGFEAWTACFPCKGSTDIFYSGGDDCKLNCYDLRASEGAPVRGNSRSHAMGVTSMVSVSDEVTVLTGSYDENLRRWDTRNMRSELDTWPLGGGLWRLRPKPGEEDRLLVAAMHDGFKVVDIGEEGRILRENRGHESLAYGADWVVDTKSHCVVASCSFYDRLFTIWGFPK